jgi:hypothetical protein
VHRTVKSSKPPLFPARFDGPTPDESRADPLERLTAEISTSAAFTSIVAYLEHAKALGFNPRDPDIVARAVRAGNTLHAAELARRTHAQSFASLRSWSGQGNHSAVVYYMRRGDLIKIGTTTRLKQRVVEIDPDGIVALELGGISVEQNRHRQFAATRSHKEWFTIDSALADHIVDLRADFVSDMMRTLDDWIAQYAPIPPTGRRRPGAWTPALDLPIRTIGCDARLGDLVDFKHAAAATGSTESAVRGWRSRGRLEPVARDRERRLLFRLSDVLSVAQRDRRTTSRRLTAGSA